MANITNYLNKIKTAVYGRDVRGAIHDAIKECYDDASVNHDNANMEVKMARGTHNTLNDRLDKSDEIQAQTNAQLSGVVDEINIRSVNVKSFGAKGDGVTDDTASIIEAINKAVELGVFKVFFPNGVYRTSSTIYLPVGVGLFGNGKKKNSVSIKYMGDTGWAIATSGGFGEHRRNIINGVSVDMKSRTADGAILIGSLTDDSIIPVQHDLIDIEIHDLSQGQTGIWLKNASGINMTQVLSQWGTGGTGLLISCNGNNAGVMNFNACGFGRVNQTDIGAELRHGKGGLDGYSFNGCYFGGKTPFKISGTSAVKNVNLNAPHFETTKNTSSEYYAMDIESVVGLTINSVTFYGNADSNFTAMMFRKMGRNIVVQGVDCNEFNNGTLYKSLITNEGDFCNNLLFEGTPTGVERTIVQTVGNFNRCVVVANQTLNTPSIVSSGNITSSDLVTCRRMKTTDVILLADKKVRYESSAPSSNVARGDFVLNTTPFETSNGNMLIGWMGVGTNNVKPCYVKTSDN